MKTEATIIVPLAAEGYMPTLAAHLCEHFGGYTRTFGYGGWRAPDGEVIEEAVYVYTVAANWFKLTSNRNRELLRGLAQPLLDDYGQQAVYLSFDGEVEIME